MASLAGAGVEEDSRTTSSAATDIGTAIAAAAVVAAIDGEAGGDAVHPAQAAFGKAVRLNASGGLAIQRAGQRTTRPVQAVLGRFTLQHRGMEAAVHIKRAVAAQPCRRDGHLCDDTF